MTARVGFVGAAFAFLVIASAAYSQSSTNRLETGPALTVAPTLPATKYGIFRSGSGAFGDISGVLSGAPYSAVLVNEAITTYADGNRVVQSDATRYYRDSSGRVRTQRENQDATPESQTGFDIVHIADPTLNKVTTLVPRDKSFHSQTLPFTRPVLASPAQAPPVQMQLQLINLGIGLGFVPEIAANTASLGEKVMEGVRVVGSRLEHVVPTGYAGNEKPITLVAEQWFSPDLGVVVLSTQTASIGTSTTSRLEQIVRAEPDASLFSVPAGYTERDGSVSFRRLEPARPR